MYIYISILLTRKDSNASAGLAQNVVVVNVAAAAGDEAEADEAEADDAAAHFRLVAKLTNTNPTVVQTNESHILDKDRSNQPWPAGAEAETDEAEADDAAAHFRLVAKLTNTNPTVALSR